MVLVGFISIVELYVSFCISWFLLPIFDSHEIYINGFAFNYSKNDLIVWIGFLMDVKIENFSALFCVYTFFLGEIVTKVCINSVWAYLVEDPNEDS